MAQRDGAGDHVSLRGWQGGKGCGGYMGRETFPVASHPFIVPPAIRRAARQDAIDGGGEADDGRLVVGE